MRPVVAILSAALLSAPLAAFAQTTAPAPTTRTAPVTPAPLTTAPPAATTTSPATTTPSATTGSPGSAARNRAATIAPAGSADEATAKQKCGADPVVWGNPGSKAFHTTDSRYYGKTKRGAYMCLKDAQSAGYHAAKSAPAAQHGKKSTAAS